ncbi:odorant receptor 9a-like [Andrena cerasifolii]|uniref:odorant receptor 9a-like n=1 Tax=Andrena cerasifolii TaxID=2819439 RepID=UPI0040384B2B
MACSCISLIIPTLLQFYVSIYNKNLDGAIETLPHFSTTTTGLIKLLSLHFNRENFRKVFLTVENDWANPVFTRDILEDVTEKGGNIAYLYRKIFWDQLLRTYYFSGALLSFLVPFLTIPLCNPILDVIIPLNETREREEIFTLYYFVNNEDHFFTIYVHSAWCSIVTVTIILAVDSLNMIITHHASAMFAICGSMIAKATEHNDVATMGRISMDEELEKIRECVVAHNKAIQFFEFLDATNRMNFLLQVGLNMIGVSATAFQTMMHLDDLKQAVRYAVFFGAQKFHLYFLSVPGQTLADYSGEYPIPNLTMGIIIIEASVIRGESCNSYSSKWYHTSARMQQMMNIMQLRASKPCQLTAGGFYEMSIANFGAAFKTCMSYFTMLLSMKE